MAQIAPYQQASDPGAVGAGVFWVNTTTGVFSVRNTANSAWVQIGNVNEANLGLLPLSGGTMTGAIEGAHGLLPTDSPAITTNATLDGDDLASKAWVNEQLLGYQEKG